MTSGPLTITASILILVAKRLRNSTYLTLARFFGLAFAVAFLCSLPLFAAGTGESCCETVCASKRRGPLEPFGSSTGPNSTAREYL